VLPGHSHEVLREREEGGHEGYLVRREVRPWAVNTALFPWNHFFDQVPLTKNPIRRPRNTSPKIKPLFAGSFAGLRGLEKMVKNDAAQSINRWGYVV
jgi:hypothetical protein